MRFLADENFPASAVAALVDSGHDVTWVQTAAPGATDTDILGWMIRENRILLTFDKDFGALARNAALPDSCGIILFRTPMPPVREVGDRLAAVIVARQDWAGHFSTIEPGRTRMRKLRHRG